MTPGVVARLRAPRPGSGGVLLPAGSLAVCWRPVDEATATMLHADGSLENVTWGAFAAAFEVAGYAELAAEALSYFELESLPPSERLRLYTPIFNSVWPRTTLPA